MATQRTINNALVVVGMCGSGKSAVAESLRDKGWTVVRFGQITMDELERRNLSVTPENERVVREGLREQHGMHAYATFLLPRVSEALAEGPVVIDGLYTWSEYKHLKEVLATTMVVVAVVCSRASRYARLARRKERPLTEEEAERRDIAEIEAIEKGGPIAMADYYLTNEGSPSDLRESVASLLRKLGWGN